MYACSTVKHVTKIIFSTTFCLCFFVVFTSAKPLNYLQHIFLLYCMDRKHENFTKIQTDWKKWNETKLDGNVRIYNIVEVITTLVSSITAQYHPKNKKSEKLLIDSEKHLAFDYWFIIITAVLCVCVRVFLMKRMFICFQFQTYKCMNCRLWTVIWHLNDKSVVNARVWYWWW